MRRTTADLNARTMAPNEPGATLISRMVGCAGPSDSRLMSGGIDGVVDVNVEAQCRCAITDEDNHARRGGIVEKVLRQQDQRLYQAVLHKSLVYLALAVRALVAASAADRAGIQHDGHASGSLSEDNMCCSQPQSALEEGGMPNAKRW